MRMLQKRQKQNIQEDEFSVGDGAGCRNLQAEAEDTFRMWILQLGDEST